MDADKQAEELITIKTTQALCRDAVGKALVRHDEELSSLRSEITDIVGKLSAIKATVCEVDNTIKGIQGYILWGVRLVTGAVVLSAVAVITEKLYKILDVTKAIGG